MENQPNVTPEEQQAYDTFVDNAYKVIYGDAFESIFKSLMENPEPVEGLAQVAVQVIRRVAQSAKGNNIDIPGDVVMHAGVEVIEDVADRMKDLGIADLSDEQMEQATYRALDLYREEELQSGEINQGAAMEDVEALKSANQSGELDAMMQELQAASGDQEPAALQQQPNPEQQQQPQSGMGGLGR